MVDFQEIASSFSTEIKIILASQGEILLLCCGQRERERKNFRRC